MKRIRDSGDELRVYAMSGMAAFLPGMQYMMELMQRQFDELRGQLALMQTGTKEKSHSNGHGWGDMSAEERSTEMKRRRAVSKHKQAAARHPRDKDHPDHAKWVAKLAKGRKAAWDRKPKAEKEAWKTAMKAAKAKQLAALAS